MARTRANAPKPPVAREPEPDAGSGGSAEEAVQVGGGETSELENEPEDDDADLVRVDTKSTGPRAKTPRAARSGRRWVTTLVTLRMGDKDIPPGEAVELELEDYKSFFARGAVKDLVE